MVNDKLTPLLLILMCSLLTITYMQVQQDKTTDYDICEEGLTFVTLEVTPQFESAAQADFYIKQYKNIAEGCIDGRLG